MKVIGACTIGTTKDFTRYNNGEVAYTLLTKDSCGGGVLIVNEEITCNQVGTLCGEKWDKMHEQSRRIYGTDGLAPTQHTCGGGNLETKIAEPFIREDFFATVREPRKYYDTSPTLRAERIGLEVCEPTELPVQNYRIRKLTPRECFRLMGVKDTDFDKIAQHQSNSKLYHLAGDSIVVDVLMAIFGAML